MGKCYGCVHFDKCSYYEKTSYVESCDCFIDENNFFIYNKKTNAWEEMSYSKYVETSLNKIKKEKRL
jgi:hypothetical protein